MLFLTTIVSLEAIYLAIFIQMTVNRNTEELQEVGQDIDEIQEDIDEIQEDVDDIGGGDSGNHASIKGMVIEGNKKGREHGFPTANIANTEKVPVGIYAARVTSDSKTFDAAVYVGAPRPHTLEAHLLDWSGDLYGKKIEVTIKKKIRDDIHQIDNDKLREMIAKDIEDIQKCLRA